MTREKGATRVDKSAHYLFDTWKMQVYEGQYATLYHEERLYSVYDKISEQVTLVYADSPKEAIRKVERSGIEMNINQIGGNSKVEKAILVCGEV